MAGRRLVLMLVTLCLAQTRADAQTTAAATTAPPTPAPITSPSIPELEPLIAKLSDSDWKVRTAAQDAIVALGEDVTARLQQLQNHSDDPEVRTAAERITHAQRLRMHGDGVDREIAAREVLVERGAEAHDGVATVGFHIVPERRDFMQGAVTVEHANGAELDADGDGAVE